MSGTPAVSVCLAAYNGAAYIGAQVESILACPGVDELLVSDDGSTDATLEVLHGVQDERLRLLRGPRRGPIGNFEHLLGQARGAIVFLADQDDIWLPGKVAEMVAALEHADLVVCDCEVADERLRTLHPSFFSLHGSGPGLWRNLVRNSYLGCCMAFRRRVVERALPFPPRIAMHDWWLGLVAQSCGRVVFLDRRLVKYRRHRGSASSTAAPSRASTLQQLRWRWDMAHALAARLLRLS